MKERLDVLLVNRGLAPSREKAKTMIMEGNVFVNNNFLYQISNHWVILLILIIGSTSIPVWLAKKWKLERFTILKLIFIVVIFLLSVAYLVDASYNPFLYFRF